MGFVERRVSRDGASADTSPPAAGRSEEWLLRDVGLAFAAALAIALAARWLLPADMGKLQAFFGLAVATAGSVAAAIYVTPHVRTRILEFALNRGLRT